MDERKIKLILGIVLKNSSKIINIWKEDDIEERIQFLKEDCQIKDEEILDFVQHINEDNLMDLDLPKDHFIYLATLADEMALKTHIGRENTFSKGKYLYSIFNILNQNQEDKVYKGTYLNHEQGINMPVDNPKENDEYYITIQKEMTKIFANFEYTREKLQSLFEFLEETLAYAPSNIIHFEDISLFDHIKISVAIASCIYDVFRNEENEDYANVYNNRVDYFHKELFYLYSLDFSGIQNFIYTIIDKGALKSLRTRSFYLEILMEDYMDTILEKLNLSRANLLYSGGGHGYLLLPNTEETLEKLRELQKAMNDWLIEEFGTELYISGGGYPCSANTLQNVPDGSYSSLFQNVSKEVSQNKLQRYSSDQLIRLNFKEENYEGRECKICRRVDNLSKREDTCNICESILQFSNHILTSDIFIISSATVKEDGLPLPFDRVLLGYSYEKFKESKIDKSKILRLYTKNKNFKDLEYGIRLWVGDYCLDKELKNLMDETHGIKRLAVLRADVDNLGQAFVQGYQDKDRSLTRSSVFSRNMSLFFKYHINYILRNGEFSIYDGKPKDRKILIVYSGGDDVFLVGSWKDVIEASIDLKNKLKEFTQNTLTISAGLGLYQSSYPIKAMAEETGNLEEYAKGYVREINGQTKEKNAVCVFHKDLVFSWDDFEESILSEKLSLLIEYYENLDEIGKSFFYKILELIRKSEERINIARLAYMLARLDERISQKEADQEFSKQIYRWAVDDKDKKELIASIYILLYLKR